MLPNVPQYPVAIAGDPARRAGGRERQSALHAARARAPAQGLGRQGDRHHRELRQRAAAGDAGGADQEGRRSRRWATCSAFPRALIVNYVVRKVKKMVPAFDLPGAVRFNDVLARARQAVQAGAGRPRRHRGAAVHRRHHRRQQGRGAAARNLVANILQSEAWYQPALKKIPKGEQIVTICALPIYHIFGFNTNVMLSMRMGGCQHPDPQPARPAGGVQAAAGREVPQLPGGQHAVQRDGQPSRLRHGRLERPGDLGRRRHGGAERDRQALAREDRLPDRRGLRPVGDLALGDLQSGRQHRLQRQHRPADAEHRAEAARRRRQRGAAGRAPARSRSRGRR